jgi:hypothetical protein
MASPSQKKEKLETLCALGVDSNAVEGETLTKAFAGMAANERRATTDALLGGTAFAPETEQCVQAFIRSCACSPPVLPC